MRKAKFQENCWPLPCVMQLIIDRRETNQVYRLHYLPAVKTLILQQTITSWRTLFIFNNNVLTAVQSCNISLNGRESMPPFSSTLGRGQSEDGLLGTPLIWEHLASWSMSFANFRERFLTGKKKKKKNKNYYVAYSEQNLPSCWSMLGVSWKKIPCDSHYFLILVWKFWSLLSKLLNGSILYVAVVRFDENHCFRMFFFFSNWNSIYTQ